MLSAAILAGGRARRLGGRAKGALIVDGRPILERVLVAVRAVTPDIMLVGGAGHAGIADDVPVVPDQIPDAGALGGLYTALQEARSEQVLVVACDMPFLTAPFLSYLAAAGQGIEAAVPRNDRGLHPLCASYARRAAPHLLARIHSGHLSVIDAVAGLEMREIGRDELAAVDPDDQVLVNVNTPDDYEQALSSTVASRRPS